MAWDLRLDPMTRDLMPGYVTGKDEIIQRLVTRLNRELGEWFLEVSAGLPWYQSGRGLLGSRNKFMMDMLIRRETRNTEGVERILKMNTVYLHRSYTIYFQLLLEQNVQVAITMTEEGFTWQTLTA
jgi:hypothetical protein